MAWSTIGLTWGNQNRWEPANLKSETLINHRGVSTEWATLLRTASYCASLPLWNFLLSTHSAAGVHAHNCGLFQFSTHTAAEPLSTTQYPRLGLTDASRLSFSKTHYISNPRSHTKRYFLPIETCSIYTFLWSMDQPTSYYSILFLGRKTLWLDLLHFELRIFHSFTVFLP